MVNQNSLLATALRARAVSLDEKLSEAYYVKLVFGTEQAIARYREVYAQSMDAWTTYWRIIGKQCAQL